MVVAALVIAISLTGAPASGASISVQAGPVAGLHPMPEATKSTKKKKTPKPTVTTPSPEVTATPISTTRRPVDEEGERWVQLAWLVGGGLLGSVLVFFAVGSLLRLGARRRKRG